MEVISKKLLYEKSNEMYEFISKYGDKYVENILNLLFVIVVCNSSFDNLSGNPPETKMEFFNLINMIGSIHFNGIEKIPTPILQLFSKFGVLHEECDPYLGIYKLLKENDFLNGNCLEVAAGKYPRLAELVRQDLYKNNHKLVIYEPDCILSKLQHVTIIKDKFSKKVDVSGIDTLYGLLPCQATIPLLEKSFEENKNLLLAFCGCDHSTPDYQHWVGDYWCEDVCMEFRERYGQEVEIINWSKQYHIPYPIMIRRKK